MGCTVRPSPLVCMSCFTSLHRVGSMLNWLNWGSKLKKLLRGLCITEIVATCEIVHTIHKHTACRSSCCCTMLYTCNEASHHGYTSSRLFLRLHSLSHCSLAANLVQCDFSGKPEMRGQPTAQQNENQTVLTVPFYSHTSEFIQCELRNVSAESQSYNCSRSAILLTSACASSSY